MSLNTRSLFKGGDVAVTYQEAVEELHEAYDTEMELDTGFSHVAMSPYESPLNDTLYERWCRIYQEKQIKKWWDMDIETWIDQPRWRMDIQIRIAEERTRAEEKVAAGILANQGKTNDKG